jgi:hypothetical protein
MAGLIDETQPIQTLPSFSTIVGGLESVLDNAG